MKIARKILSLALIFVCSMFLFSGCRARKYELIGIIEDGKTEVTLLPQLADGETKDYLIDAYECAIYIDLKNNKDFVMGYTIHENDLTIEYTQTGTYEINEEENTIIFYTKKSDGSLKENKQQYENDMIIYYDGVEYLAFK